MSTDVTTAVGTFVWHEHVSSDPERAQAFYRDLFGWEIEVFKPGEMDYAMIKAGGTTHGGFGKAEGGAPNHWMGHVLVEDVDATAASVKAGGATSSSGRPTFPRSVASRSSPTPRARSSRPSSPMEARAHRQPASSTGTS